jgi:hypothetical protein
MKRSAKLLSSPAAIIASATALHCGPVQTSRHEPALDETLGVTVQKFSQLGVERVIPIRFIVLDDFAAACGIQLTAANFAGAVREANNIWLSTGIQFSLSRFDRYNTPQFKDLRTPGNKAWANVQPELSQIDSTLTAGLFAGQATTAEGWTQLVSNVMSPNEVNVWVPCDDSSSHAPYPWQGNSQWIHVFAGQIADPSAPGLGFKQTTLAHELGHYLGLTHPWMMGNAPLSDDPDPSFFYDLWWATNGDGSLRLFTSKADLLAFDPDGTRRRAKGQTCGGDTANGDVTCTINGVNYKTSTNPAVVQPIGLTHQPGQVYGTNNMHYLLGADGTGAWNAYSGFGGTQVARLRNTIRSTQGKRHLLGRGRNASYVNRSQFSQKLDFDGDGKRDLAYWRPSDKSCHVMKSTNGTELVIPIAQADPALGDEPMAGDYDGDGKTDCAVYRPALGSSQGIWFWAKSGSGYQVATDQLGAVGDIPIAGVSLPASFIYGKYAVYSPSTTTFRWRDSSLSVRNFIFGQRGDDLALADYDGDGLTDIALWRPEVNAGQAASAFYVSMSSGDFSSWKGLWFGESTDVPMGPVRRDANNKLEFAVFRPSNGTWYYLMNPTEPTGGSFTSEQWGIPGDIPVSGWDQDRDGFSDAIIYRPKSNDGPTFWVKKSAGGFFGITVGDDGDVPFVSEDRDGDGGIELWLYRPNTADYFINWSSLGYLQFGQYRFGTYTDVPL